LQVSRDGQLEASYLLHERQSLLCRNSRMQYLNSNIVSGVASHCVHGIVASTLHPKGSSLSGYEGYATPAIRRSCVYQRFITAPLCLYFLSLSFDHIDKKD